MPKQSLEGLVCGCWVDEKCPIHKVSVKPKLVQANDNRFAILRADAIELRKKEKVLRDEATMHANVAKRAGVKTPVGEIAARQSARATAEADGIGSQASMLEETVRSSKSPGGDR